MLFISYIFFLFFIPLVGSENSDPCFVFILEDVVQVSAMLILMSRIFFTGGLTEQVLLCEEDKLNNLYMSPKEAWSKGRDDCKTFPIIKVKIHSTSTSEHIM